MNSANHIVFGVGFTAISCSFLDVNIYGLQPMAVTVAASLIPDIDHPSSLTGKLIPPISKRINRQVGHRTLTHSLFFLLSTTAAAYFLGFGAVWFFALLSHIIGDMVTRAGVAFLYPFNSNRWVVPGERRWRLKSDDTRGEMAVFVLSCALCISTFDLAQAGIKTTFQRTFKTWSHARAEAETKPTFVKSGSTAGEVVKVNSNYLTVFDGQDFSRIEEGSSIEDIREAGDFEVIDFEFERISADSLRSFRNILSGEIQSNYPFSWRSGVIEKSGKLASIEEVQFFDFTEPVPESNSEQIRELEIRLSIFEDIRRDVLAEFNLIQERIKSINAEFQKLSSYEKGKAIKELEQLKAEKLPKQNPKIKELKNQIELLKTQTGDTVYFTGILKLVAHGKGTFDQ